MAVSWLATESASATFIDNVTPTVLYTSAQGAGKTVRIEKLIVTNVNASSRTLTLYHVPSGGAISGNDWKVIYARTIDGLGEEDVRDAAGIHLDNGDSIRALVSAASSIRFHMSLSLES